MKPAGNVCLNGGLWRRREADLKGALPGVGQAVLQLVTEAVSRQGAAALPEESQDLLRGQISELWRHNDPVRTLVGQQEGPQQQSGGGIFL